MIKDNLDIEKWTPEEHLEQMMYILKIADDYKYEVKKEQGHYDTCDKCDFSIKHKTLYIDISYEGEASWGGYCLAHAFDHLLDIHEMGLNEEAHSNFWRGECEDDE